MTRSLAIIRNWLLLKALRMEKLVAAEGAAHGQSVYLLGDEYWKDVFEFIGPYMGERED